LLEEVDLVTNHHNLNRRKREHFDFVHPIFGFLEALPVGDIVDDDDSVGDFVVGLRQSLVLLLASSVPDLDLDSFVLDGDFLRVKVQCNCCDDVFVELVLYEPDDHIGLPDSRLSDYNELY
jgi:hypothetical protein